MNATLLTALTGAGTLLAGADGRAAASAAATIAAAMVLPVLAATVVLAWHAARGSDPGPAAQHLLTLVHTLWTRPMRR